MEIKIPCKPYVKKYLVKRYGYDFVLSSKDHVGIMLFMLLKKHYNEKPYKEMIRQYTEQYPVQVSTSQLFKKGARHLTEYSIVRFNLFMEYIIKDKFHEYVEDAEYNGTLQIDAIRDFMNKYEFEETDIDYEALRKSYQRYQLKAEKIKKGAPTLSRL